MFFVYLLLCSDGSTYVGATTDLNQRLRKHNGEIKGGAVATGNKVKRGETWIRACHVEGFPNWQSALQFEWRWKQISRTLSCSLLPLERRMTALTNLLSLDRSTQKAIPFTEWETQPKVNIEIEEAKLYYINQT
jgi:hypothetical protein